jgi:hypothetical protein
VLAMMPANRDWRKPTGVGFATDKLKPSSRGYSNPRDYALSS